MKQSQTNSTEVETVAVMGGKSFEHLLTENVATVTVNGKDIATTEVATEKPEVPKLSRKEIGRLRRQFYTTVHGTVVACGHKAKFSASKQPRTNCVDCWMAFFMTAVDLDAVHKLLTEQGVKKLVAKYGTKFVRNFHGFLAMSLMPKGIQGETQEELQEII